ncbi:hypothetical protein Tco_0246551 [Tanacetum coccineum]
MNESRCRRMQMQTDADADGCRCRRMQMQTDADADSDGCRFRQIQMQNKQNRVEPRHVVDAGDATHNYLRHSRIIQTPRNLIAQLIALITELEAFADPGEVFDMLMCLRDDRRAEETKLADLNDLIT